MHPGERHLGGARQVQAVLLERVDVGPLGREEPGADHRLLAHEHGRQDRRESGPRDVVDRETVESQREQRGVADHVPEAGAGEPRRTLELEPPDLCGLAGLTPRRLAHAAELDGVLLAVAVGDVVVGRVRDLEERGVALGLRRGERVLRLLQLGLHALEHLELLRRRLALELRPRAQVVDARYEVAPAGVGLEKAVERVRGALPRERSPHRVGIGPGCLEVDHEAESRSSTASMTEATPSASGPAHVESATARRRGWPVSTATP